MRGLLVRQIPVRLLDLSVAGCCLESSREIAPGTTGDLRSISGEQPIATLCGSSDATSGTGRACCTWGASFPGGLDRERLPCAVSYERLYRPGRVRRSQAGSFSTLLLLGTGLGITTYRRRR